jgi:4-amino-4-deoxy-L-arabinose transferase-like glycosyltransferase
MTAEKLVDLAIRHRSLFVILLGVLLYVAFTGLRDVWYPDEPNIAEVALAMYQSGDWILPRRMGVAWVDYPPMIYWVGNISAHVFDSMNAFTLRLPNGLVAIIIVLITGATAARWFDARTGFWAAFALMTSMLFVYEANSYRPDLLFTVFIVGAFILYADGSLDRPRLWLRAAAFACLGFAMLSKGILGLLLPGLILVLWHLSRKEWLRIIQLAPLSLIALLIFLPWVAGTAETMGWDNILTEFYEQNFARFQSGFRGHAQPPWYYLKNFWIDFMPWSWLFPAALVWTVKSGLLKNERVQLLCWWFGTFFVFLSIAETKRQLYMLPAFPAIALLLAPWLATIGRGEPTRTQVLRGLPNDRPVHIYAIILAVVFFGTGLLLFSAFALFDVLIVRDDMLVAKRAVAEALRFPLLLLALTIIAAGVWVGLAWRVQDTRDELRRIGVSYVALYIVILAIVMPQFEPTKSYAPQGQWIRTEIGPDEKHIGMVYPGGGGIAKRGAFGYETGGAMVDLLETPQQVDDFFSRYPNSLVLVQEQSVDRIFSADDSDWRKRVQRELWVGKTLYLVVRNQTVN